MTLFPNDDKSDDVDDSSAHHYASTDTQKCVGLSTMYSRQLDAMLVSAGIGSVPAPCYVQLHQHWSVAR
jgi:hypothetical protein